MNANWHQKHRLARGATLKARVAWHVAHQKACACREMPASVRDELARQGGEPGDQTPKKKVAKAPRQTRASAPKGLRGRARR